MAYYGLQHYNYNTLMNMYCSYYTKIYHKIPHRTATEINGIQTSKDMLISMIEELMTYER